MEPPLSELLAHGFVTPASLHYVRNHGPVPRIEWGAHRLAVNGLVDRPAVFTMDELLGSFEHVDVLCTLTCAGNRRKVRAPQAACALLRRQPVGGFSVCLEHRCSSK